MMVGEWMYGCFPCLTWVLNSVYGDAKKDR